MSNWVKDGERVTADYMGTEVSGTVLESRVKYGGTVQYTVQLDQPIQLRWRTEPTEQLLVDADDLKVEHTMTKFFHIVQVHPVENGVPNTHKVVLEKEFDTMLEADEFIEVFNHNPVADRHGGDTVAVYAGCVNDETGELV